jgi:hypothetical protein
MKIFKGISKPEEINFQTTRYVFKESAIAFTWFYIS